MVVIIHLFVSIYCCEACNQVIVFIVLTFRITFMLLGGPQAVLASPPSPASASYSSIDSTFEMVSMEGVHSQSSPRPSTWQPRFRPRLAVDDAPEHIAALISRQTWRRLHAIPLKEWIRSTFGHGTDSLEDFFWYHIRLLPAVVSSYVHMYPDQLQRYMRVEEVGHTRHSYLPSAYNVNSC